jgi:putative tryptophan/tyrosine transport system substrate-binding protein
MDRRAFFCGLTLGALSSTVVGEAQQATRVYRVGCLLSYPLTRTPLLEVFEQGLRDAGYVRGINLAIELRYPLSWVDSRRDELLDGLAADMAGRHFDVIVAAWNPAIAAVSRTVANTPIVMVGAIDPVGNGFVRSTSRPGPHVTGLMWDIGFTKQLEVLKEAVPKLSRVAVLRDPTGGRGPDYWREAEVAAAARGITILSVDIRRQENLETAIQKLSEEHFDAILMWEGPLFWQHSGVILGIARANRVPVMASSKEYVEMGALLSYGADTRVPFRRAALYVSRILNGANPADLPVERPGAFELPRLGRRECGFHAVTQARCLALRRRGTRCRFGLRPG